MLNYLNYKNLIKFFDCRTTGLLKSGAMKVEDKPIWYDIFAAFPPKLEPKFDRPEPNMEIKPLFYNEDVVRA